MTGSHARLEELAADILGRPGVDWGRMFGTIGLRVRGKVFAVAVRDGVMLKVPKSRADELVAGGEASRVVMAGRARREWVVVPHEADDEAWAARLEEAFAYVDEITPPAGA